MFECVVGGDCCLLPQVDAKDNMHPLTLAIRRPISRWSVRCVRRFCEFDDHIDLFIMYIAVAFAELDDDEPFWRLV